MPLLNSNNPLNKPIALSNLIWAILVLILLAGNAYFAFNYLENKKQLAQSQNALETQKAQAQFNEKNLAFTKLFVQEVLKAEAEVDFETRLTLENAVRNLEDEEILSQWQKFVDSKTDDEAQTQVKNLLEMLVSKIQL